MYSRPVIFAIISILVLALIYDSTFIPNVSSKITRSGETCNPVGDGRQFCCGIEKDDRGTRTPTDDTYRTYCETCTDYGPDLRICDDYEGPQPPQPSGPAVLPEDGVLEQPPTPPPSGPASPLQDGGVLEEPATPPGLTPPTSGQGVLSEDGVLRQTPSEGVAPPLTQDQGVLPEDGDLDQTPADQGAAAPQTVEPPADEEATQPPPKPLAPCPEGQVFNEETGLCVLEDCPEGQVLDEESGICVLAEPETAAEEPEQSEPEEENQPSEESDSGESSNN